ncbi:hypothetical protein [Snuella sedimenti]|uniref:Uncharacterized protein n=1 Tax=Snuella sedimenti TaxID=2798802 RepID=A0A8J7J0V2_9FLAO|nr:hypothetical protein [Snuella sedimenti]MBJ6367507.1 hypothetical protein [Snuella sedimenti]
MGYELNIQKEEENNKISKQEWIDYMESDPEFERIEEISADLGDNEVLTIATPGGLWKSDKGEIPFTFSEKYGEITVKSPEHWIIEKMISIAQNLNAEVIGEEGEKYDEEYLNDPFGNPFENESSSNEKKWWQFWK